MADETETGWSYTAGRHGHKVRVFERKDRKNLYVSVWEDGQEVKRSLGHANQGKAMDYADDLAGEIRRGELERVKDSEEKPPTAGRVFALYREEVSPDKGAYSRKADERHAELWNRFLGSGFDLSKLSRREWDRFVRKRRSGAIGPRGKSVAKAKRRPVGARALEKDLAWLRAVCRWAMDFREHEDGPLLLDRDPTRGREIPKEKNPARPVATHDRVDAIREVYRDVQMQAGGKIVESYLSEIFEIVVGTGRRISAVCSLRVEDLDLEETKKTPWGAIVWPEDTDKMGKTWRCPISERVKEALEAAKAKRAKVTRRVGKGPLFPEPSDPDASVGYYDAATWLRSAERKAELEPQDGSLWHAFRRLWASSRKGLPDIDVAEAGGWKSTEALRQAYQRPDDETMLRVVTHEAELREVK